MFEFITLCYVCKIYNRETEATATDRGGAVCPQCKLSKQIAAIEHDVDMEYAYTGRLRNRLDEIAALKKQLAELGPRIPLNSIDMRST